jgi:hypothetical protein
LEHGNKLIICHDIENTINRRLETRRPSEVDKEWVERQTGLLLAPNGLMTAVALIRLSFFILSGSGVERRTMDRPEAVGSSTWISPLLGNR